MALIPAILHSRETSIPWGTAISPERTCSFVEAVIKVVERLMEHLPPGKVGKWAVIGGLFTGGNLLFLYALVDLCRLPVPLATLITATTGTLFRFLANDRFVFKQRRPTWARLKKYCVAIALGAAIWYGVANFLYWIGVHYLVATIAATCCSVGCNFTANFLWVWRNRQGTPEP